VLAPSAHTTPELAALSQIQGLQLITNPLELAGIRDRIGVLFMDARISWLPWADLHLADSLGPEARCIIYNSAQLPESSRVALQSQATLHPGDVSADLVQGYLLGSATARLHAAQQAPSSPAVDAPPDLLTPHH